jgi:hypothetical protein
VAADPSITDWISAVSTAALGVLGFFITVWQWRRTGFSPRLRARIDAGRDAIELLVVNTGRAAGIVDQVDVKGPTGEIVGGGGVTPRVVTPVDTPPGVGIFGLKSVLPPGALT